MAVATKKPAAASKPATPTKPSAPMTPCPVGDAPPSGAALARLKEVLRVQNASADEAWRDCPDVLARLREKADLPTDDPGPRAPHSHVNPLTGAVARPTTAHGPATRRTFNSPSMRLRAMLGKPDASVNDLAWGAAGEIERLEKLARSRLD